MDLVFFDNRGCILICPPTIYCQKSHTYYSFFVKFCTSRMFLNFGCVLIFTPPNIQYIPSILSYLHQKNVAWGYIFTPFPYLTLHTVTQILWLEWNNSRTTITPKITVIWYILNSMPLSVSTLIVKIKEKPPLHQYLRQMIRFINEHKTDFEGPIVHYNEDKKSSFI